MSNEERRGGIGFGNQRRVDAGARPIDDEDNGESTRAMDIGGLEPQATEYLRSPAPPPQRPAPQPMRPSLRPQPARPAPPPPSHDEPEEEAATRMLDAMDDSLMPDRPAPQPQGKALDLKVISGPDRGKVHKIGEGDSLVGRGLDCQIVLADPAVSRKHFQVRRNGDQAVLEDMGGPNGTKVNGEKRARHVLEPGDQIEVGMSVMEFQVEGQGKRRAESRPVADDRAPAQSSRGAAKSSGGKGKWVAIGAGLLVLLIAAGAGAWLVLGKKSGAEAEAKAQGGGEGDIDAMLKQAEKQLADKDFTGAVETLKKIKELDKGNAEAGKLMRQAGKESTAQQALDEAKKAIEGGKLDEAKTHLEEIDKDSVFAGEAATQLTLVKSTLVKNKLEEAKKAEAAGDAKAALVAAQAVLELDAENADAKQISARLAAGAAPAAVAGAVPAADAGAVPAADAGAGAAEPAKAVDPKAAAAVAGAGAVAAAAPGAAPAGADAAAKKADLQAGLTAYGARQWSAAKQAFEAVANGPFAKEDKKKAKTYADAVARVESAWNKAGSAQGKAAAGAWKDAREADGDVNSAHKAFLTEQVIKAYVTAAKTARAGGNCAEAVEMAEEAANYTATGSHPEAKAVADGCKADGKKLLDQAEQALAGGRAAQAKELAAKAEKILGPSDPLTQKARDILKKASAAGRGEE